MVSVPASTANLGAGLDVLGLAVSIRVEAGIAAPSDHPPSGARLVDEHHPAALAFVAAGGRGQMWLRSSVPMGRGLGFSAAVRVAGALVAAVQRGEIADGAPSVAQRAGILRLVASLEGHGDNAAASIHGGLVAVMGDEAVEIPLVLRPTIVVWVPDGVTTSTTRSRASLPSAVPLADAVHNLGRVAALVAAFSTGRADLLAAATDDRLHQPHRLDPDGDATRAIRSGRSAGAWAGWLSGSGPSVALACDGDTVDAVVAALPASGHAKVLAVETVGAQVIATG